MAPVFASMVSPAGEALYVPPVVPVRVTGWPPVSDLQKGVPAYEMVAAGWAVMVTDVVMGTAAHPAVAGMVYVMV